MRIVLIGTSFRYQFKTMKVSNNSSFPFKKSSHGSIPSVHHHFLLNVVAQKSCSTVYRPRTLYVCTKNTQIYSNLCLSYIFIISPLLDYPRFFCNVKHAFFPGALQILVIFIKSSGNFSNLL